MNSSEEELKRCEALEKERSRVLERLAEARAALEQLRRRRAELGSRLESMEPEGVMEDLVRADVEIKVRTEHVAALEERLKRIEDEMLAGASNAPLFAQKLGEQLMRRFTEEELLPAIKKLLPVLNRGAALALAAGYKLGLGAILGVIIPDPVDPRRNLAAVADDSPQAEAEALTSKNAELFFEHAGRIVKAEFLEDRRARKLYHEYCWVQDTVARTKRLAETVLEERRQREKTPEQIERERREAEQKRQEWDAAMRRQKARQEEYEEGRRERGLAR